MTVFEWLNADNTPESRLFVSFLNDTKESSLMILDGG